MVLVCDTNRTKILAKAQSGVCDSTGTKLWARAHWSLSTVASFQGRLVERRVLLILE